MEFPEQLFQNGQNLEKSEALEQATLLTADIDIIHSTSKNISNSMNQQKTIIKKRQSSMLEYLQANKKQRVICQDKSKPLKPIVHHTTSSSRMSRPVLTLKEKASYGFWTKSKLEMSRKLWSPIQTDSLVSESTCLNVHSTNITSHSTWFRVILNSQTLKANSLMIFSPFVTSSWPKTTASEPLPMLEIDAKNSLKIPSKKEINKLGAPISSIKIKLNPRKFIDRDRLFQYFGIARWTYNQAVSIARDKNIISIRSQLIDDKTGGSLSWKKFLRALLINDDSDAIKEFNWLKNLGYDIRDAALTDFLNAMKGCWTKLENGTIEIFKLKFRSRKRDKSETVYIRSRWISIKGNYLIIAWPRQPKMKFFIGKNAFKGNIKMDCRLKRSWDNSYYLCIPNSYIPQIKKFDEFVVDNQDQINAKNNNLKIASLDPGVRTFQTVLDINNSRCYEVGAGDMKRIVRICNVLDRMISNRDKNKKSRKRCKINRVIKRLRIRIKNLVEEVHKQLAKFLAFNYDVIIIPKFEVSGMIRKCERKIGNKSVRQMLCWNHYNFRQRLIFKCRQLGSKVIVVNEAWTSKTCSNCGYIKHNLGGNKQFRCNNCFVIMDRDINGAKNIFLRNYEALDISVKDISSFGAYPLLAGNSK